jgi:hypothetical protein
LKQQKTDGYLEKKVHTETFKNPKKRKQAEAELNSGSDSEEIKAKKAKLAFDDYSLWERLEKYN